MDSLKMDDWVITFIAQQLRLVLSSRTDPEIKARSEEELDQLVGMKKEIRQIQRGETQIHVNYLQDDHLIRYWEEAYTTFLRILLWDSRNSANYKSKMIRLAELEELGNALANRLTDGPTRPNNIDMRHEVHRKVRKYDQVINAFHKEAGTFRCGFEWNHIVSNLRYCSEKQKEYYARSQTKTQLIATLWMNFAILTVTSIAFLGVGFFYSSGSQGRWRDADFWFLLQSCAVQLGGLFITSISFHNPSIYDWAAGCAAVVFTIIAPVMYVKAPSTAR